MHLLILSCFVLGVLAEPPRFRLSRYRFQRQELAPSTTDPPTEPTTEAAPYPASGWKPAGQPFTLPNEKAPNDTYGPPQVNAPYPASGWKPQQPFTLPTEQQLPAVSYGAPDNTYSPPSNTYGPPSNTYGPPSNTYGLPGSEATEAATTTDNPQVERLDGSVETQKSSGKYFVLLPNGQLQRIELFTQDNVKPMKYTAAKLQLRDRAPLFMFRP